MTTDGTRLMANWNPGRPLREVLADGPLMEEIKPIGEYPIKLPNCPIKYLPHDIEASP